MSSTMKIAVVGSGVSGLGATWVSLLIRSKITGAERPSSCSTSTHLMRCIYTSQRHDLAAMRTPSALIGKVRTRVRAWMWIRKSCCSCRTRWTLIRGLLQRFRGFLMTAARLRAAHELILSAFERRFPGTSGSWQWRFDACLPCLCAL